jgi:hypothetical protein
MIKKLDIVLTVAIALGIRALIDMSIAQALVALGFLGVLAYTKYLESKKQPDYVSMFKSELDDVKSKMSSLYVKQAVKTQNTEGKRFF